MTRGAIALSSLYLLSFFAQKIILQNPMVEFALGWIDGGDRAAELSSFADYDGAIIAGGTIVGCIGVLAFNRVREARAGHPQKSLEQS